MRRATECFSMTSLMSMRTIALSSSNRNEASALVSSVLPTPVGPRNRNEPIGRLGASKPSRERRPRPWLADEGGFERALHVQQLLALAFEHLVDGDAGPARDDLRDVLRR